MPRGQALIQLMDFEDGTPAYGKATVDLRHVL